MPRPSRLGLALAATVAASSLFVGGGFAAAAPTIPCTNEAKTEPVGCDATEPVSGGTTGGGTDGTTDGTTGGGTTDGTTGGGADQNNGGAAGGGAAGGGAAGGGAAGGGAAGGGAAGGGAAGGGAAGGGAAGGGAAGGGADQNSGGAASGSGGQDKGTGYQKPGSYKPWKGDRGNARKDRNDPPRRQGDEKDCRDFDNRNEAQDWYRSHGKPGDKDPSRLDRDNDGRACENDDDDGDDSDPVIPPNVDVTVIINQTEDDGSEAEVSGTQIKQVPEGSVDTGSAQ